MTNFDFNSLCHYLHDENNIAQIPANLIESDNHIFVKKGILVKKMASTPFCSYCLYQVQYSHGDFFYCDSCETSLCEDEVIKEVYEYSDIGMCNMLNEKLCIPVKHKHLSTGLFELGVYQRCNIYYTRCYTSEQKRRLKDVKNKIIITGAPTYDNDEKVIYLSRICNINDNEIIVDIRIKDYVVTEIIQPEPNKRSEETRIRREFVVKCYLIRAEQVLKGESECKKPANKEVVTFLASNGIVADENDIKNDVRFLRNQMCTLVGNTNFRLLYDSLKSQNIEELESAIKTDYTVAMQKTIKQSSKSNQSATKLIEELEKKNDSNNPNKFKNLAQKGMHKQKYLSA